MREGQRVEIKKDNEKALVLKGLSKRYGKLEALKIEDLEFENNKIYGLLGRNGAGKTTMLRLINNEIIRNSGDIRAFGEEVFENSKALEKICLIKEKVYPDEDKRVKDIFKLASILYLNWDEEYKKHLVQSFKIDDKKRYKNLSRGMQSVVGLIVGLASRAPITIFDEPALGLDAAHRDDFYRLLLEDYEKSPRTIIISTHLIDEAASIFEKVIILDKGQVKLSQDTIELSEKAKFLSGRRETIEEMLKGKKIIHQESFGATAIYGVLDDFNEEELSKLRSSNIEISPMPLQKLFINLTKES